MISARAPAKLNLALVVGPRRPDGKHEVVSPMIPLELSDGIVVKPADELLVEGFAEDTLVSRALRALEGEAGADRSWRVAIDKRIPVSAGLGGGSSDAGTVLRLANETLPEPLPATQLHQLAAGLGADVPFFLAPGPAVARGDGTSLERADIPRDYEVVLLLPDGVSKRSTAAVYEAFDARRGEEGFEQRVAELEGALQGHDLAALPRNDLASSPHGDALERLGAFRADVTGAGPAVYGLFRSGDDAAEAAGAIASLGRVWRTKPAW